jgi:hypothetical protein
MLGRLLNIGEHAGIGLAVTYWSWALEMAPVDSRGVPDLRGLVTDFEAVVVGVGWDAAETDKLHRALLLTGLFQDDPMRVRGLSRYLVYFEKKARDAKRQRNYRKTKVENVTRDVHVTSRDVSRRGEERRREEIRRDPPPLEEEAKASVAVATSPPPPPDKLLDSADVFATVDAFFAETQAHRSEHGLRPEQPPGAEKLLAWWSDVCAFLGEDLSLIGPAYLKYLRDPYWQDAKPEWPFNGFVAQWRNHVPPRRTAAAN